MPASVQLRITEGIAKGKLFTFAAHDTFFLGRHPDCQMHLPDDTFVSRHHFILEVCPPQACVRDLGSRNGTYVNGRKVGGRQETIPPKLAAWFAAALASNAKQRFLSGFEMKEKLHQLNPHDC